MRQRPLLVLVFGLVTACGDSEFEKRDKPLSQVENVNPVEDIGTPPEEAQAGDGTTWVCRFTGWGDSGGTTFEFEDVLEFCFEEDAVSDFIITWEQDCADAFEADGFYTYECAVVCDDTFDTC